MADRHGAQKRKRHEIATEDLQTRIGGKIHHEKKEVRKAARKAKSFETQKIVKRLKDLRTKIAEHGAINKFEAELDSVKVTNHDAIGDYAFKSKILKDSTLRRCDAVIAFATEQLESQPLLPAEPGTAVARIQNRLLSSKNLSAQVAASIASLKRFLDPDAKRQKVELSKVDADASPSSDTVKVSGPTRVDEDDLESEPAADNASWSSGTVDGEGIDDDESGSEADIPLQPIDGFESDELEEENHGGMYKQRKAEVGSLSQSTFLPSLSVGFTEGSDDSDFDEGDDRASDMPRKNRRGQRARRLIWEKKYGRNANHKKKEALERAEILAKRMLKGQQKARQINLATGANVTKPMTNERISQWPTSKQNTHVKDLKPLHPSWEAKRKLKEKDRAAIVTSQAKKITF